jgi:hypothetical protein
MNAEQIPLLPIEEQSNVESESKSFSSSARYAIAAGSLLCLGAVAALAYDSSSTNSLSMPSTTNLAVWDIADDLAFCPNTFVYGVTPRTAAKGCVVISRDDLFDPIAETGIAMPASHLCIGSSDRDGLLKVNFDMIKQMGDGMYFDETTGYHSLSGISPGQEVDVQIFSGKNFDGKMATIKANEDGRLPTKFYEDGTTANDNVNSFIIMSTADHFFAGKDCSLNAQVCTAVITAEEALKEVPAGCTLITSRDPVPLRGAAQTNAARICATKRSPDILVDNLALTALDMIHDNGDKKSQISYIKNGKQIKIQYYESRSGDGESLLGTHQLEHKKYSNGHIVNDNIYSMKLHSDASVLPKSCEL